MHWQEFGQIGDVTLAASETENENVSRTFTKVMGSTNENQGQWENAHTPTVRTEN